MPRLICLCWAHMPFCWLCHEVTQVCYNNAGDKAGTFQRGGGRGGSVVECRTPEREVGGSKPTAAVLCPWARHFTPRKYWLITQEAVAPSRHDWKIVDWDVKPQHKQNFSKDPVHRGNGSLLQIEKPYTYKFMKQFISNLYQNSRFVKQFVMRHTIY